MKFLLLSGALVCGGYDMGLRWNATPSMPIGMWRVAAFHQPKRGDAIALCLPEAAARFGLERGYLAGGDCPGGAEMLIKTIAAVPGDHVMVSADGITVNGEVIPNSRPLPIDEAGRPLIAPSGQFGVGNSEVWIVSNNDPRSYDSRYFGPVPLSDIRGSAQPLIVLH